MTAWVDGALVEVEPAFGAEHRVDRRVVGRDEARAPPAMRFAYGVFFVGIGASGVWLAQLVRGFRKYRRKKRLNGEAVQKPPRARDRRPSDCI